MDEALQKVRSTMERCKSEQGGTGPGGIHAEEPKQGSGHTSASSAGVGGKNIPGGGGDGGSPGTGSNGDSSHMY
tara:strand:+ start:430 stop:651 length:222 start_codon:yes stop_codon:yes gene_type:complete